MTTPLTPARIAYDEWWLSLSRMGDPMRRPHIVSESFGAGYHAALLAHPERDQRRTVLTATIVLGDVPEVPLTLKDLFGEPSPVAADFLAGHPEITR